MPLEQLNVIETDKCVVCLSQSTLFCLDNPGKTSKQKIEHVILLILHSPCDPKALLKNRSNVGAADTGIVYNTLLLRVTFCNS